MLKHIVMWKLKDSLDAIEKSEAAKEMKIQLEDLKNEISQIKSIEVGLNINSSISAYDVVLYSEFKDEIDLHIYHNHPEHKKVAEYVAEVTENRSVVDYIT